MPRRVDGEATVGADRPPGAEHLLRLPGKGAHPVGPGPEAGGGGLLRLLAFAELLAGHDHEELAALVVAEAELPDGPVLGLDRGRVAGRRGVEGGTQALRLQQLLDARD